uniref:Protein transporter n=1 Tax=Xenopsylla cheopis TaxID=163159 RepID=A0A6M2DJD1_XENCH
MLDALRPVLNVFWSESVWLPPNITWHDISPESSDVIKHADYRDLIYPIPMAFVVLFMRKILERYWFWPIGVSLGIKNTRPKRAVANPLLESAYQKNSRIKYKQILSLSKQLDWTERQIERWWRLRRAQDKPSTLVKFCENSWRCLYYSYSFVYGLIALWDKPWLWNIDECWKQYPHQSVNNETWWYYMISMSFYWSLCISQFTDVRRKDFWQMFVHHCATITLMAFSWICNMHRIGTLVLLVHDCADIFLEAAKITKYANYQKLCDCIFGFFTIIWIITRLGVYPFWIMYSTAVTAPNFVPVFPAYYIFNGLLSLLLMLHIAWTYLILQIAYKALAAGQMEGDLRSSSSDLSDSSGAGNDKVILNNHTSH